LRRAGRRGVAPIGARQAEGGFGVAGCVGPGRIEIGIAEAIIHRVEAAG